MDQLPRERKKGKNACLFQCVGNVREREKRERLNERGRIEKNQQREGRKVERE